MHTTDTELVAFNQAVDILLRSGHYDSIQFHENLQVFNRFLEYRYTDFVRLYDGKTHKNVMRVACRSLDAMSDEGAIVSVITLLDSILMFHGYNEEFLVNFIKKNCVISILTDRLSDKIEYQEVFEAIVYLMSDIFYKFPACHSEFIKYDVKKVLRELLDVEIVEILNDLEEEYNELVNMNSADNPLQQQSLEAHIQIQMDLQAVQKSANELLTMIVQFSMSHMISVFSAQNTQQEPANKKIKLDDFEASSAPVNN